MESLQWCLSWIGFVKCFTKSKPARHSQHHFQHHFLNVVLEFWMWCWKSECGAGKRKRKCECGAAKVVLRMSCWLTFCKCFSVHLFGLSVYVSFTVFTAKLKSLKCWNTDLKFVALVFCHFIWLVVNLSISIIQLQFKLGTLQNLTHCSFLIKLSWFKLLDIK